MNNYMVDFGNGRHFRTTEAEYLFASRPEHGRVSFHKTRTAAKRNAGRFGDVKPTTEVKVAAGKITHYRTPPSGEWQEVS